MCENTTVFKTVFNGFQKPCVKIHRFSIFVPGFPRNCHGVRARRPHPSHARHVYSLYIHLCTAHGLCERELTPGRSRVFTPPRVLSHRTPGAFSRATEHGFENHCVFTHGFLKIVESRLDNSCIFTHGCVGSLSHKP